MGEEAGREKRPTKGLPGNELKKIGAREDFSWHWLKTARRAKQRREYEKNIYVEKTFRSRPVVCTGAVPSPDCRMGGNLAMKYVESYLGSSPYKYGDRIPCEVCGATAVDIHHIRARGMGGSKHRDHPENLIALCRRCHNEYGDRKQYREMLYIIAADRCATWK